MKTWSCLGVELCQFCPGRLESQRYKWQKLAKIWPSGVDRGVENQL